MTASIPTRPAKGFTLLELLLVVSLIALLIGLVAPSAQNVLEGLRLSQAVQVVEAELNLAQQAAITHNRDTEVRFYQYALSGERNETPGLPGTGRFRALQVFEVTDSGKSIPIEGIKLLPPSLILDSGGALSSLIGSATASIPPKRAAAPQTVAIPPSGTQYNYVSFSFRPDGTTNLSPVPAVPWFITLHSSRAGDGLTAPPKNFATLQIDPVNGSTQIFRP